MSNRSTKIIQEIYEHLIDTHVNMAKIIKIFQSAIKIRKYCKLAKNSRILSPKQVGVKMHRNFDVFVLITDRQMDYRR